MFLPASIADYVHNEGDIIGLRFAAPGAQGYKTYFLRCLLREYPNNLAEYSLGSASAQAVAGTGYNEIEDASGNNYLEPQLEGQMYQVFWGVAPSYVRIYRQFPGGIDRGSLIVNRAIGGQVGWIDGEMAPYKTPSPVTMMHTLQDVNPQFNGYHPRALPATVTVYMYFWTVRFVVENISNAIMPADQARAKYFTPGGVRPLVDAPLWLQKGARG